MKERWSRTFYTPMIRKIFILILTGLMLPALSASSATAESYKEITVSAALSLKNAFEEIGKAYEEKNRGVKVLWNFGASGALVRQIEGGAPVDVFASAAQKDMDDLQAKGLIISGTRIGFAGNSVVLVVSKTSMLHIKSFAALASRDVKRIAMGNPKTVPAGRYAEEVLSFYKIEPYVKDKRIYAENVRQVLDYVARGEVDAGIVYATDAKTRVKDVIVVASAPAESHQPVVYPAAVVKGTSAEASARKFVEMLRSEEGKRILLKYGFGIPR